MGGNPKLTNLHRTGEDKLVQEDHEQIYQQRIEEMKNIITRAEEYFDEDERQTMPVIDSIGREQEMSIISESGLYNFIFCSRKPDAKKFKKWITSEVLSALRKTGKFDMGQSTAAPTVSAMPLDEDELTLLKVRSGGQDRGCN